MKPALLSGVAWDPKLNPPAALVLVPPKVGAGGDCATEPNDGGGAAAVAAPKGLAGVAVLVVLPNEGVDCAVEPNVGGAAVVGGAKGLAVGAVLLALPNDGVDPKPPPVLPLLPKVGAGLLLLLPKVGAAVLAAAPNEGVAAALLPKLNPEVLDAVAELPNVVALLEAGAPKLNGDFALLVEVGAAGAGAGDAAVEPKLGGVAVLEPNVN